MKLEKGWIIETGGKHYRVELVNECRALCVPSEREVRVVTDRVFDKTVTFTVEGRAISISPESEVRRVK